jgi:pyruvate dehydrogenase E2 component (dihydrolipoamide acetyltransferase)
MSEFRMPAMGAGMDEGKLLEWYVHPGDTVERGQIVALIDTDKTAIEVEIFEDGVIEELLVPEGTKVPVGTPLARLAPTAGLEEPYREQATPAVPDEAAPDADPLTEMDPPAWTPPPAPEPWPEPVAAHVERRPPVPEPASPAARRLRVLSPVVRRMARDHRVDLTTVRGTGPGGVITRSDVEREIADRGERAGPVAAGSRIPGAEAAASGGNGGRRPASSPYARRLAREHGLDLAALRGTGPGGAITARDIAREPAPTPAPPPARAPAPARASPGPAQARDAGAGTDRAAAMRRAIARAMTISNREIPHYHLGHHVDMEPALAWLTDHNRALPPNERVLPAVLVLKAVALACRAHPAFNGLWVDDELQPAEGVHVGVAIALRGGGLVVPAIHRTDELPLDELMAALRDLVARARAGTLRGSELRDGTITVTNLGDQGVETVHGVIFPPQVALVGAGRIVERAWAVDGLVGARRVLHLTLAADHRASDGHAGGRFLDTIARHLERPEPL